MNQALVELTSQGLIQELKVINLKIQQILHMCAKFSKQAC